MPSPSARRRAGRTKERILEVALGLFNARGTPAVSTNRIARALGMSPGNLYYHFRNKEEIIRSLLERLSREWEPLYTLPATRQPALNEVDGVLRGHLYTLRRYRFIFREITALTRRHPGLRVQFDRERSRGHKRFVHLINGLVRSGIMRMPDGRNEVTTLADTCLMMAAFWLLFVELGNGHVSDRKIEEGVNTLRLILRPYMTGANR